MDSGSKNLDYWRQYGQYVLMAMPYADEVLVEARGCTLRDADGKELLDLAAGMFCCVLGHNHPSFIKRLTRQAEQLASYRYAVSLAGCAGSRIKAGWV